MATCEKCGKEFEARGDWQKVCLDCYKAGTKAEKKPAATTSSKSNYTKKAEVNAELFRKAYDELVAEFSDILPDVKEYLGGWTSTIVINRSK